MNTTPTDHKIEFMAWDEREKQIVCWKDISRTNILGMLVNNHNRNNSMAILMQLTALRSINDEPIYNHMIVKDEHGDHFIIDMFKYMKMYALSIAKLEIVGNRFQHPHLLEMCK